MNRNNAENEIQMMVNGEIEMDDDIDTDEDDEEVDKEEEDRIRCFDKRAVSMDKIPILAKT